MPRVVHYRVHGLSADRLERVHEQVAALAAAREWRGDAPWPFLDDSVRLFR